MPRVLIVYGTNHGHTAKIAQAMAGTLRLRGMVADVALASRTAPAADGYDAVIVAGSVHAGAYQKPVVRWVQANRAALGKRHTAFVSVSLGVLQKEPHVQQEVRAIIDRFQIATGWVPDAIEMAAGALLYTKYNWLIRLIMKRIVAKAGGDTDTRRDHVYTDWAALERFTSAFADRLVATARPGQTGRADAIMNAAVTDGRLSA